MIRSNEDSAGQYKHPANGRPSGWNLSCETINTSVIKHIIINMFGQGIEMKNIRILIDNIDISKVLKEVNSYPDNWNFDTRRQRFLKYHEHTETINLVQGYDPDPKVRDVRDSHTYRPTKLYDYYPETIKILKSFFPVGLSRIAIIKLKAGKRVHPHFDGGKYYEVRDRYHLVLTGSYEYFVGGESQQVSPGMLFWFDNKKVHSAFNNTTEDRISVIFDVEH